MSETATSSGRWTTTRVWWRWPPAISSPAGGSVSDAAELVRIPPSSVKRHLADLRARSGLTTEQLIYRGRADGWLVVPSLDSG